MNNKILTFILIFLLFLTSCAIKRIYLVEYNINEYDYDRLYHATLIALNNLNFTPISYNKEDGIIYCKDYSSLYTATTLGLFGIIPWIYSVADYPTLTLVFYKAKDRIFLSYNESNSCLIENTIFENLTSEISKWYYAGAFKF